LPFKAAQNHFILLIGLLVGIGAVLLFMRWPPLGLLGLIAARLVPFNGPSGITVTMLLVALLLGLWLFDMMVRQRKIQLVSSLTILPSLLLIAVALLAFGVGQLPWYTFAESAPLGAQMGGMAIYTFSVGAFLLMVHQIRDLRWLQVMTWLFLILSAIFIIGRITGTGQFISFLFPRGTTDSLFWTWLAALAFSQAVFNRDLHPVWRLSLGGLLLATFYVAYMLNEGWKSGWVPPVFVIVAILGIHFWRMALILTPFGIIPLSRLISYGIASDEYSYSTRIDAWTIVLEITKVNPILGLGPSNYRWYTPLFPIRGWVVQFNSHSQYIDLIAQTGLLGLACFVWFFGAVSWLGWQLQERVPSGFARAYVYGALGGLVGTLVAAALGDWVLPFFYNVGLKGFSSSILVWLFLGGLVALEQIYVKPNHLT
jgi:O-antigen ligase